MISITSGENSALEKFFIAHRPLLRAVGQRQEKVEVPGWARAQTKSSGAAGVPRYVAGW
ncbi:hypothetical protein [Bradyrhizobium frederickii]|uniref:hypothetical protein n=1 Tax=Bradyrhizobium frederickii TaxID=2560054 RepID=UPI00142FE9B7|nr:hypothetical protein [Bradyrhizobium frederickii]